MMFRGLQDTICPSRSQSLAGAFIRLGWVGFWLQVVFGSLPLLGMAYYFVFSGSGTILRSRAGFVEYLTIANLVMLLFTILWSYRYTRLGKRIRDPERCPPASDLLGTVWTGVVVGAAGMLFSMIVILIEAANLLFYFLKSPQAGIPVIQTSGAAAEHWVSSVDMISLMSLILLLFAELVVLLFSLWLLFRTAMGSPELPPATAPGEVHEQGVGTHHAPQHTEIEPAT
jgi:hypothetical protein